MPPAVASAPATPAADQRLTGVVKHLTFVNPENGYFVARVEVPGKGERVVTGNAPIIHVGEQISAQGAWQSSSWGPQFKASSVLLSAPTMCEGIERYLASAVEGIGPSYAKKLVEAFGEAVFDIIEGEPARLFDVKGIGKKRAEAIIAAYSQQRAVRAIMVFLHKAGLSTSKAKKVFDRWGESAIERIKQNPYILAHEVYGIGFATADGVALRQGLDRESPERARAGVLHVLREAEGQGSCGLPLAQVLERAHVLLDVGYALIEQALALEVAEGSLVRAHAAGHDCVFSARISGAEEFIARVLREHSGRTPALRVTDIEAVIAQAEAAVGLKLESAQREAVRCALRNQVCVITGGPGSGKTTITRVILRALREAGLEGRLLAAPTGKAAKRAQEATGEPARTLHRTLEVGPDGRFARNQDNPLEADVLVVDEMSMVSVPLMRSICAALSPRTRLVLIGDVDQLPSVGPGKVLHDILESGALPAVRLRTVFRQAQTSDIVQNAHAINRGEHPRQGLVPGSDFQYIVMEPRNPRDEAEKQRCRQDMAQKVLRLVAQMRSRGWCPIREVQVLLPMRKGALGTEALNAQLQAALNPQPARSVELFGARWGVGDKVMQLRNNYEKSVFNGDIGFIADIDTDNRVLDIEFDGTRVAYKYSDLDELTLAYAFTIHKSQGSEFPVVVLALDAGHYMMLRRNLLYTAVTRARELCVLVGQPWAVDRAVEQAQVDERYSRLRDLLSAGLPWQGSRAPVSPEEAQETRP
jgi:exodeoxyribonuclease V alpha subunit